MLQYEVTRKQLLDKQQKKIEAMEARAAELRRQKAEHGRQWAVAQRERELAKVGGPFFLCGAAAPPVPCAELLGPLFPPRILAPIPSTPSRRPCQPVPRRPPLNGRSWPRSRSATARRCASRPSATAARGSCTGRRRRTRGSARRRRSRGWRPLPVFLGCPARAARAQFAAERSLLAGCMTAPGRKTR